MQNCCNGSVWRLFSDKNAHWLSHLHILYGLFLPFLWASMQSDDRRQVKHGCCTAPANVCVASSLELQAHSTRSTLYHPPWRKVSSLQSLSTGVSSEKLDLIEGADMRSCCSAITVCKHNFWEAARDWRSEQALRASEAISKTDTLQQFWMDLKACWWLAGVINFKPITSPCKDPLSDIPAWTPPKQLPTSLRDHTRQDADSSRAWEGWRAPTAHPEQQEHVQQAIVALYSACPKASTVQCPPAVTQTAEKAYEWGNTAPPFPD